MVTVVIAVSLTDELLSIFGNLNASRCADQGDVAELVDEADDDITWVSPVHGSVPHYIAKVERHSYLQQSG